MRLTTLGTSCAQQTTSRTQSAHALSITPSITYLFDCGSSTATTLIQSGIKYSSIQKVFVTHLHTDHVIGLPGLLTDILGGHGGNIKDFQEGLKREGPARRVLDIYGPLGIKEFLRTTFRLTYTLLATSFRIHELLFDEDPVNNDEPFLREEGSRDLRIAAGHWIDISVDDRCKVTAVPILHSVPSLAYIITEDDSIRIPDTYVQKLKDVFKGKNVSLIQTAMRDLKAGKSISLEDETIGPLEREKGRQVVILGDTCDASTILKHVEPPISLLLHEATNAYLPSYCKDEDTFASTKLRAIDRGHSTPDMAGELARKCDSQFLVLTHFSSRYSGADNPGAVKIMKYFEQLAHLAGSASQTTVEALFATQNGQTHKRPKKERKDSTRDNDMTYDGNIIAAWDGMYIDIPRTGLMIRR
ncbi:protein of unknown function [Taphrina deformans PYCC 5710]|uniref:Uncharacterized protein n=1 Tax=Taphrina deformans (strain PYCC 5710 / ATCC 11124 / CBS 356.35 / IMI 108563 / JCM 9778 / NBRC 8474) TaxID=1097556 RepID=R4XBA8_TAPDE|nr:protein of unknown function [Taphrina deformans PYCC 5710]|eukprot:CCG80613.1 protein of unknown function [Taphrina deformans PYCC 5710]